MRRLLRTSGLLGLLLGLMLLPMGCSGSQGETASSPSPSWADPYYEPSVEINFASGPAERFEVSGELLGHGKRTDAVHVISRSIDLRMPAQIDGSRALLALTLLVDEETKVYDRSGDVVPWSEQESAIDSSYAWTALVRIEEPGRLYALELQQVKLPDSSLPPPVVTGLLTQLPDGLVDVPGMPIARMYTKGEVLVEMEQAVTFEGGRAVVFTNLAVDDHSEVVMNPQGDGSRDELLERMGRVDWPGGWQVTARLEEDGTLTLVKLVGTAPPGS